MNELNKQDIAPKTVTISLMQIIGALAVVTLHTNGDFWVYSTEDYWASANIIECIFYFAVPLFLMISGITLIDYQDRYSTKTYFIRRIKRVLIPYLVWMMVYIVFEQIKHYYVHGNVEIPSIVELLNAFLNGLGVYWFFPVLFCVYLSIPLFASIEREKRKPLFSYLVCFGILLNVMIPFIISITEAKISWPYSVSAVTGYMIWPVLGYLLYKYQIRNKTKIILIILGTCGLLAHIFGTYYLSTNAGTIIQTYKGYTNLPCVLYTIGVFIILMEMGNLISKKAGVCSTIIWLSSFSFPIYLMHIFIMDILLWLFEFDTTTLVWRIGSPPIIALICIGITTIIKKIPVLKEIV